MTILFYGLEVFSE